MENHSLQVTGGARGKKQARRERAEIDGWEKMGEARPGTKEVRTVQPEL